MKNIFRLLEYVPRLKSCAMNQLHFKKVIALYVATKQKKEFAQYKLFLKMILYFPRLKPWAII